jgi:hypothetical protein
MSETIDCRSEAGVTIGLIDAIISIARIVAKRDLKNPGVEEALLDFLDDNDLLALRAAALQVEARRDWDGH